MKKFALLLLLLTGILHIVEAPEYYAEVQYIGVLFVLNFLGALLGCFWIYKDKAIGWHLGMLISVLSVIAFVLSRSVGLPFFMGEIGEWSDESAIFSAITEVLFLVPYVWFVRKA